MPDARAFFFTVAAPDQGERLDVFLKNAIPELTRSALTRLIQSGNVRVNGAPRKPGYAVKTDDAVRVDVPAPKPLDLSPAPVAFEVVHEDDDLLVIDKPPGLVVHPAPGHDSGTLVHGLLHRTPHMGPVGDAMRPGIVHRLDKDTSGLLVVAKNNAVHQALSRQFQARSVRKTYLALVSGEMREDGGRISLPVGRHPVHRKKMSAGGRRGRCAETVWKVRERLPGATLLEIDLKTGRTHQIRVHMAAIRRPVLGDELYGGKQMRKLPAGAGFNRSVGQATRQMLHSFRLTFLHPGARSEMTFEAPPPEDMRRILEQLRGAAPETEARAPRCDATNRNQATSLS